jgi:serine/threonine protein kinase
MPNNRPLVPHINTSTITTPIPLSIVSGSHLELEDWELRVHPLPYMHMKMLGHGGSASVEMVQDINTGIVYARKVIRNVYRRNMQEARKRLHDEVQIMRKLSDHHHIAKVHATYIAKRELAIIIDPAANSGDLASYLQDRHDSLIDGADPGPDEILSHSFGCLASGLAFIHQQSIRHKDIKPQNILIHNGSVMYADFGLSYDFGDAERSTTTGLVQGLTRRYCAPEVAQGRARNSSSDVFSLGCVYLEIVDSLYAGYMEEDLLAGPFHEKLLALENDFWVRVEKEWKPVMKLLKGLLSDDPSQRPSAKELVSQWVDLFAEQPWIRCFCMPCLLHPNFPSIQPPVWRYSLTEFTMFVGQDDQLVHYVTQLDPKGKLIDLDLPIPEWQRQYPEFDFLQSQMSHCLHKRNILNCNASIRITNRRYPRGSLSITCNLETQQDLSVFTSVECTTRFYDSGKIEPDLRFDVQDSKSLKESRTPCDYKADFGRRNSVLRVAFGSKFWVSRIIKYQSIMHTDESSVRQSLLHLTATQDIYGTKTGGETEHLLTILWRFRQTRDLVEVGSTNWRVLNLSPGP